MCRTYVEDLLRLEQWPFNQGNAPHSGRCVDSKDFHGNRIGPSQSLQFKVSSLVIRHGISQKTWNLEHGTLNPVELSVAGWQSL